MLSRLPSFQSCLSRSVGPKNGFLKREKENCLIVATEEEETNLFRCFLSLKIEQKETKWDNGIYLSMVFVLKRRTEPTFGASRVN